MAERKLDASPNYIAGLVSELNSYQLGGCSGARAFRQNVLPSKCRVFVSLAESRVPFKWRSVKRVHLLSEYPVDMKNLERGKSTD